MNDAIKGQRNVQLVIEVFKFSVNPSATITYNGQEYTGVTSFVPKFFYELPDGQGGTEEVIIQQGVPTVFHYPSEVINTWAAAETSTQTISDDWQTGQLERLAFTLRRIITTELPIPLFGLATRTDWNVEGERSK
ncbi:MAG: hypothetical protein MK172_08715 [Verrucomicrobiales bacterium]|nr:hypothetical protein [Verrucomicrobiales bacterium]